MSRPVAARKPVVEMQVLEAVVKEQAKDATYLIMDSTTKVIVYEFTTTGENFMTTVASFLSAYCIKTGSKMETMLILRSVEEEQFEEIRQHARHAIVACQDHSNIKLTKREKECSELLLRQPGIANKEIANELNLSERTVKFHMSSLLNKCKVDKRAALGPKLRAVLPTVMVEGD